MTTRTTTFADTSAGQLEVIFSGAFTFSVSGDAGFPTTSGADIVLECTVSNAGGQLAKAYINREAPSTHVVLTYPGGSASWTASVTDVRSTFGGGLGSMGVTPKVTFVLIKK